MKRSDSIMKVNLPPSKRWPIFAATLGCVFLIAAQPCLGDQNWDADNAVGNFSYNDNWYFNSQPAWGFSNGSLHFSYHNNGSQTSLYYDYGDWVNTNDVVFDSTFSASTPVNGNGNGINFNQRLENYSSYTQTINIPLSGGKNGAGRIELNPVNGDLTVNGTIYNDNNVGYQVFGNQGKTLTVNSTLVGNSSVSFTIQQNSNVKFAAIQTYGGATVINAGKLEAAVAGALGGTSSVSVNTGGTLLLSGSGNRIGDTAGITLNGGKFDTGGLSEKVGALTLSGNSVIDMGASGASILQFAASNGISWGSGTLSIWNWSGNLTGGGTDRLFVGTTPSGLDVSQLSKISFFAGAGTDPLGNATILSSGEIVPVPEPSSVAIMFGLFSLVAWREQCRAREMRTSDRCQFPALS